MTLRPISLRAARKYVAAVHRHHDAPQGGKFALAAWHEGVLVGVSIIGRPVSRMLDNGLIAEVIRVATYGTCNACSFLYGASKRAAHAMGYTKVITYTLVEESGASLRAVGWSRCGIAGVGVVVGPIASTAGSSPVAGKDQMGDRRMTPAEFTALMDQKTPEQILCMAAACAQNHEPREALRLIRHADDLLSVEVMRQEQPR